MKMRKYFVMALVALGATAAFSSCQKDDKGGAALGPEISLYNSDNTVRIAANQSDVIKDKEFIVRVTLAKDVKLESLRWNFAYVKTDGSKTSQFEKGKEEKLPTKTNPTTQVEEVLFNKDLPTQNGAITFIAKDKNGKVTELTRVVSLDGKSGGETQTGTPMKNENTAAYVNHANGQGAGAYSFSGRKSVRLEGTDKKDWEIYNVSDGAKTEFKAKFSSTDEAGFSFVKLNSGDVDYAKATVEKVSALIKDAKKEIELAEGDMFIAKANDGQTFYLAKVTKMSKEGYYDGAEKAAASTAKGKGYILFSYKSNK